MTNAPPSLPPFPIRSQIVGGQSTAERTACRLIAASAWFAVTPFPDNEWKFETKDEYPADRSGTSAFEGLLRSCKELLAIVAIQNGNLYPDVNEIQERAKAAIEVAQV